MFSRPLMVISFGRLAEGCHKLIKLLLAQLHFREVRRRKAPCLGRLTVHNERTQRLNATLGQLSQSCPVDGYVRCMSNRIAIDLQLDDCSLPSR